MSKIVIGTISGLLVALVAALIFSTEEINLRSGHSFLQKYYRQVVKEKKRRDAWEDLLTESWQNTHEFRRADEFFSKWDRISVGNVRKMEDDTFSAQVTYVNGDAQARTGLLFRLDCAFLIVKSPFHECDPDDLRIDEVEELKSLDTQPPPNLC